MKKNSAFVSGIVTVLLLGAAGSAHAAKYNIHWYLGHPTLDYFEEAARNFKSEVETRSHGDIAVEIVLAHADGAENGPTIAAMVEKGDVEMGHSFTDVLGGLDGRLYAFEAPYLFRDYRHMEGVFEGPIGAQLLDGFRAHKMVGLSFTYSGGASGVASDKELRRPEDLKGLKVGVFGDAANEAWLRSLGAVPVTIGHDLSGVKSLAKAGQLDAVVVTWRNFERAELNASFNRFSLPGSTYLVSATYINEKFFESLPAEYRKLISEASLKAGRIERAKTIELNESAKRQMTDKGVRTVYLTAEGRRDFDAALRPAYRSKLDGLIGKSFLDRVRKTAGGREHPAMPLDLATR